MSAHFNTPTDEMLLLAETLGEVKTKADKLEAEFATQARPLEAATNALSAALSGIKALQFHVLDNNLGQLSARVEEMRKAVDEQVGVIALELKKADETNAAKAGQEAEALRSEIAALQAQLGTLGAQFSAQLERVEFSAKEEAKKLQLIPGPAGAAGASLNPRGTFIDGETYNRLDVVSWLGSSYIAAVDGVTEKPSKNSNQWQVLASRGSGGSGGAGDFGSLAGVAQINQGGTGQTTRAAGLNALLPSQTGNVQFMLLTDGAGNVSWGAQPVAGLPSQTSNSGKLLTTDGTNASWSNAVTVSGNNATVTGTLTTIGATGSFGSSSSAGTSLKVISGVGTLASPKYSTLDFRTYNDSASGAYIRTGNRQSDTAAFELEIATRSNSDVLTQIATFSDSKLSILATTASTSTSSGALVVSGGVGVAGNINGGGAILAQGALSSIPAVNYLSTELSSGQGYITCYNGSGSAYLALNYRASQHNFTSNGAVAVQSTTASTTTSSGALVVSGGVGVAGKVNAGSFTTTGHTTSAVENVNVSTTAVDIAIATSVGAIYFVSGYNNSNGAQGTWLLMVRGTNVTTVSSDNNTGLTVTFSLSSGKLQAATASGTLVTNAYAITR